MAARDMVVAAGRGPDDVVRRRRGGEIALPAPVEESERRKGPAQNAYVVVLAGAEDGEEPVVGDQQTRGPGALEEAAESGELGPEGGVVEEPGDGVLGERGQLAVVQREDIGGFGRRGERGGRVAEEEQRAADRDEVAGRTGCRGTEPTGPGEGEFGAPEGGGTGPVEPS
nr:hypothetical protein [Streptomyces tsukubensis NRRL18488]